MTDAALSHAFVKFAGLSLAMVAEGKLNTYNWEEQTLVTSRMNLERWQLTHGCP